MENNHELHDKEKKERAPKRYISLINCNNKTQYIYKSVSNELGQTEYDLITLFNK